MNKLLIALFATLIAATTIFASVAEAGGRGGMRNHFRHLHLIQHQQNDAYKAKKRSYYAAKKRKARKARIAKSNSATAAPKAEVAKVDDTKTEQSSISSGTTEVAVAEVTEEVFTATRELGCKKFFPSAGLTLTVPCE